MAVTHLETTNEDFLNIREATIDATDSEQMSAFLKFHGHIPTNDDGGAFGYCILTLKGLDAVVVSTIHPGILYSKDQTDADAPIWHNHFMILLKDSEYYFECICEAFIFIGMTLQYDE